MEKSRIYVESSTISYLTARRSRDIVLNAKQELTHEWWELRDRFDLFVSETVVEEISEGDPEAAEARLQVVQGIPLLVINEAIKPLAQALLRAGAVPIKSETDAVHIAYSAVYEMDFLITWNQKHIATDARRRFIEDVLLDSGFHLPRLLTPEQHLLTMED